MPYICYAGIGSREISYREARVIYDLAQIFGKLGFVLRSGGCTGSDSEFEEGCDSVNGAKEIYLPYNGYNNKYRSKNIFVETHNKQEKLDIIKEIHPRKNLSKLSLLMHSRNINIILGKDLRKPVRAAFCYTEGGKLIGGTAFGIRLAKSRNIPVINIGNSRQYDQCSKFIELYNEIGLI